jgi:hypothetical protein
MSTCSLGSECVAIGPALSYSNQKSRLVRLHLPDEGLIASIFVPGRPENHFREDWRKIDSFRGQQLNHLSSVRRIWFRGDDSYATNFRRRSANIFVAIPSSHSRNSL